jgi:hypothetical protein
LDFGIGNTFVSGGRGEVSFTLIAFQGEADREKPCTLGHEDTPVDTKVSSTLSSNGAGQFILAKWSQLYAKAGSAVINRLPAGIK